ncbi:MAG: PA4642 family protein [Proteobacteria bacterium]|nr:PA4642 family protein [Pseudomonadota bacterium]
MKEQKKSGKDRVQPATRDEVWSDQRLQTFLEWEPPESLPADYNILLRAYRGMTADLFKRFLVFYLESDRDINVPLEDGSTFLDLVSQHRKSVDYAAALAAAGAIATRAQK